jgi:hypothetical protein
MPGSAVSDEAEIAVNNAEAAEVEAAADDADDDALVDTDDDADDEEDDAKDEDADESPIEDRGKDEASKPPVRRKNEEAAANGRSAVAADAGNAPLSANQSESEPVVSSIRDGVISSGATNAPSVRAQINRPSRASVDVNDGDRCGSHSDCKTRRSRSG